ncbi:class I SAM-dependent methyltransferase [Paenibacillus alba]|uniref:Class I SAM-dependent methyltransferase n=1 Tax=Paenibacillus alba TaxID=1197127 RepID=A0ABU6GEQ4_9BACL|nr:class I SAM-dependent methyltransferase [Paenibacillus alba]MEC0232714.1 class I SAM-dependent methyltransferase [Paenibacillus alba]
MDKLNQEEVSNFYNSVEDIWPANDKWHRYTRKVIEKYIHQTISTENLLPNDMKILNAGSAGEEYSVQGEHYHVDIAQERIKHRPNSFVTSIENLPFSDNFFDICICVGSVINYCNDALQAISEFSRVLKSNGLLILEFDSSNSFEYLFTPAFSQSAHIIKTFYDGTEQRIWVYSNDYIENLLKTANFTMKNTKNFHIASSLFYKLTSLSNISSKFSFLDKWLHKTPLSKFSCNVILSVVKKT